MDFRGKIFLTGASGFIGSNLLNFLIGKGVEVNVVYRKNSKRDLIANVEGKVKQYIYDGTLESLSFALKDSHPDVVVHLASLFIAEHGTDDVVPLLESNILFSTQLAEAMVVNNIGRIINTGTAWQHYQNSSYNPVNLYASTKQAFEDILMYYHEAKGLSVTNLHLYDTYGPCDWRPKLINLLVKMIKDGGTLEMSAGEQLVDFTYIDDLVKAYWVAINQICKSQDNYLFTYAVRSQESLTLRSLVGLLEEISHKELDIKWAVKPYRRREVMSPPSIIKTLPGWSPEISLRQGLANMVEVCV